MPRGYSSLKVLLVATVVGLCGLTVAPRTLAAEATETHTANDATDEPAVTPDTILPRLTVFVEASSFYLVSRGAIAADFRLLSVADDWVHVMANAGIGTTSFFFGPPNLDVHATAGVLFFPGRHHVELRGGAMAVSNSVAGDGPYLYPLFQVGYRYTHASSPLALSILLGTTGASLGLGLAF